MSIRTCLAKFWVVSGTIIEKKIRKNKNINNFNYLLSPGENGNFAVFPEKQKVPRTVTVTVTVSTEHASFFLSVIFVSITVASH